MHPAKILFILRECGSRSESSQDKHVQKVRFLTLRLKHFYNDGDDVYTTIMCLSVLSFDFLQMLPSGRFASDSSFVN